jgi:hypothetical protein
MTNSGQVAAINSLCQALCLDLAIVGAGSQMAILSAAAARTARPPLRPRPAAIKQEPIQDYLGHGTAANSVSIKREQFEVAAKSSYIPTVQTATVAAASWLKCPNADCKFLSGSIADMQHHMAGCRTATAKQQVVSGGAEGGDGGIAGDLTSPDTGASATTAVQAFGHRDPEQRKEEHVSDPPPPPETSGSRGPEVAATPHVDLKLNPLSIKREQIKQEGPDPLERKVEVKAGEPTVKKVVLSSPLKLDNIKLEAAEEARDEDDMEDELQPDQISVRYWIPYLVFFIILWNLILTDPYIKQLLVRKVLTVHRT